MRELGLPCEENRVIRCSPELEAAAESFRIFAESCGVDGVVCANDVLAAGVLLAAKDMGIAVPEELSVIGYNNSLLARSTNPRLTSLENNVEKLAEFTAANLNDLFNSRQAVKEYKADFELVLRESLYQIYHRAI